MFTEIKTLLHWAEFGVAVERRTGFFRFVHETKEETFERLLKLAAAVICSDCRGYGETTVGTACASCKGTGNLLGKHVSSLPRP